VFFAHSGKLSAPRRKKDRNTINMESIGTPTSDTRTSGRAPTPQTDHAERFRLKATRNGLFLRKWKSVDTGFYKRKNLKTIHHLPVTMAFCRMFSGNGKIDGFVASCRHPRKAGVRTFVFRIPLPSE
jgi:hypothetical protein